jgi:anti-sigma factor RsiW
MTDPRTAAHASHDSVLVASLADHSLPADERAAAERLVAGCGLCAALYADLVSLRTATRSMPTPSRPRDFRLTPDDAIRLRPSGWRRWVAAFGSPRDAFSRPLALGLTTLGIAGLLVASAPSLMPTGGAASAPAAGGSNDRTMTESTRLEAAPEISTDTQGAAGAQGAAPAAGSADPAENLAASGAPAPAATQELYLNGRPSAAPAVPGDITSGDNDTPGQVDGAGPAADPGEAAADGSLSATTTGPSTLVVVSGLLLVVGLGLFLLRWFARRAGT